MRNKVLLAGLAAAVAACGGDDTVCGTGTTKQGNACVADNGSNSGSNGSGTDVTCGTGTHLMGTMCVPDDNTVASAPTITMMDPAASGISGGGLFTITGTGFNGSNVTDLHVFFGDPTNTSCEATLGAASATAVSGQIPGGCTFSAQVTVTVQTNVGSATTPFNYEMIFAADGLAGGAQGNEFWVIDPFTSRGFDLGVLSDTTADQNAYNFGGMDFDSTGVLYAATSGIADADLDLTSQLVTIDLSNGAVASLGEVTDVDGNPYFVRDMKFVGGTLYAWAFTFDANGNDLDSGLISISTTDGTATPIGPSSIDNSFAGGLAVDGSGALIAAVHGAGNDANASNPTTGEIDSVNTTTGALSDVANIEWGFGAPIQAMTTFPGQTPLILAVVDSGEYGVENQVGAYNETLAILNPSNESISPVFELPATTINQSHIDALAVPPATLVISRKAPRSGWTQLKVPTGAVALPRTR